MFHSGFNISDLLNIFNIFMLVPTIPEEKNKIHS